MPENLNPELENPESAAVETPPSPVVEELVEHNETPLPESSTGSLETPTEEGSKTEESSAAAPAPEPKPQTDWKDRRIAQLTARLKEFQESKAKTGEVPTPDPLEDFNKRVDEAAARRVEEREFSARCNAVIAKGQEQFGKDEFDARLGQLKNIVDQTDPAAIAAYETFIKAGLETGNLDRIIYDLAADPNETVKVLSMPPMKMAVELARRASMPEAGEVSKTPKPIRPVNGNRTYTPVDPTDEASDRLTTAEWMRRRNAQVAGTR